MSTESGHHVLLQAMPGGNTRTSLFSSPFPLTLAKGDGCKVWDLDGHEYVDGVSEFTAGVAGHSHPVIQRAIREALADGINLGGHTSAELAFAEVGADSEPNGVMICMGFLVFAGKYICCVYHGAKFLGALRLSAFMLNPTMAIHAIRRKD